MNEKVRENLFSLFKKAHSFAILTVMALIFSCIPATAAVIVEPGTGIYTTLKDAFDAINSGTHTGAISISITSDTTETLPAVLNASGTGAASYSSISIQPSGGAARTISGAIAGGSPLLDLNGADNVTIDGLNSGGNSLTISNTTVSPFAGTSTIRFQADATNNTIRNCSILGSSTMATATNGGNIWFGAAATVNGNDNNIISNNNIGPAGSNLPTKLIYSMGSTTSTALYNSYVLIDNNNLFDYFNPAAQSNAVYLGAGNTGWTISNNRIFQTATRTQTTGAILAGIQIASATGNDGHTITGNIIGFANSVGTGTTNLVGVSAVSKFLGIYISAAATTTPSSIQGNTIAGINLSGVVGGTGTIASFVGISVAAGVANIGNITGNTVGSLSSPGSISVTSNNTVAMEVYGIYYFPNAAATISNNNVGGITAANSGTGSLLLYGIRAYTVSTVLNTMQNNTVGSAAAPITTTSAAALSRTIGLYCQAGACIVTGNIISNLSMNSPNTGANASASMLGLWIDNISSVLGNNITLNTIRSLSNTDPAAAVWVTGLQYNGANTGTHNVQRNFIHTLSVDSSSATATVNGINVQAGLTTFQNNMVAIGSIMTANSPQINGIAELVAGTSNFYHNSVYIGGAGVAAGTANSFAFQSSITTNTRNYRNNIFYNARSNDAATGKHYVVRVGGTAQNPAGLTLNNNVYFANGIGAVFGLFNGLDVADLSAWKTVAGQDTGSFSQAPQYLNPATATPDLHINTLVATDVEGNGAEVGVTDDFDGQTRAALTPVDIGADAGNFMGADLIAPNISYVAFGNTAMTNNRILAVTMMDVTGIATGGSAPRIYLNKNGGVYSSSACSLSSGTAQNGVWNCTIDNALLGGVATSDVIRYFVVAQDTLGYLGANPASGFTGANVNTVTAPPTTPNQYSIVVPFTGSYNVGAGETFTSLTNAGGLFEAINARVLTGDVTINISADLTGESGIVALNQWAEEGAGGYTLLIRPSGGARLISGSSAASLIRLNDADRVTIDGSTSGATAVGIGGEALLRELTITNTNAGASAVVLTLSGVVNGAQNNTFRNLSIIGQDPLTTLVGISLGGATAGTAGLDNDNNRIENCSVQKVKVGIYSSGQSAANPNTGTVFIRNDLSAAGASRVSRAGIAIFNDDGAQITENSVGGMDTNENQDAIGIGLGTVSILNTFITSGGVINAVVSGNKISGVSNTSTFSASGIAVAGGTGGTNTIVNNMITGVIANSTLGDIPAGIFVAGVAGSSTKLFYNSVAMTGNRGTTVSQMPGYGVAITGTDPTVELKNNIFYNAQDPGSGGVNAKSYAIGTAATTFVNLDSNYNDFFSGGPLPGYFRSGTLNTGAGTDYATLAGWQAAVAKDASSRSEDPLFSDPSGNLHLTAASTMLAQGTPVAGIGNDFDGQPRKNPPDIGADEVVLYTVTPSAGANGGISPNTPLSVAGGDSASFTIKPAPSFRVEIPVGGTCGGSYSGDPLDPVNGISYTTNSIAADCTVAASFTPIVCTAQPSGLMAWWKGAGSPGDLIGSHSGTLTNVSYASGKVGQAFSFSGSNSYFTVDGISSDFDFTNKPFSIAAWIRIASDATGGAAGYMSIFDRSQPGFADGYRLDYSVTSHDFRLLGTSVLTIPATLLPDTWYHVAAVSQNGAGSAMYLNGAQIGSTGTHTTNNWAVAPRIGDCQAVGDASFKGQIDEVQIFNRALNLAEIQGIYNADVRGVCYPATLTVAIAGSGSVTSQSTEGTNYACSKAAGGSCDPIAFNFDDQVTLFPTGSNSSFSAWSGAITGNSNPGSVAMEGNKAVTATFNADPAKVQIDGDVTPYYSIGAALDACVLDGAVRTQAAPLFSENVVMTSNYTLKLRGGFTDAGFTDGSQTGYSTVSGSLKVRDGRLTVERVKITP